MRLFLSFTLFALLTSLGLVGCGTVGVSAPTPTTVFLPRTVTFAPIPTATWTILPTRTPTQEPTATATATVTFTPTPSPLPTATPPPGWKKLESATIELWVPSSFVGGDPIKDKGAIVNVLRALGSEYISSYSVVEQHADVFLLYALDSKIGNTGLITTLSVTFNRLLPSGLIDQTQSGVAWQLPRQTIVLDKRNVRLYYAAERTIAEAAAHNNRVRYLIYTIKSTNYAWVLAFATPEDEYFSRFATFEQIAQTIRIRQ